MPIFKKSSLVKLGIAGGLLTVGMGLLHLPFAAPVLRTIMPASVCPMKAGTPQQVDASYRLNLDAVRKDAKGPAPARPALAWELDKSTNQDLMAWASKNGVKCERIAGNETLARCVDVPAAAVGQPSDFAPLEDVTFAFRSTGELVSVSTTRRRLTPQEASRIAGTLDARDGAALGEPTKRGGEPTAAHLGRSFLSTYVAEYTFTDYRASIAATNLAPTGIMVREQYLSLN